MPATIELYPNPKPIITLDFDGVIHSYSSGWKGAANIPDPPVEGAMLWIERAVEKVRVCIFSSRSHQAGGIDAMRGWLHMHLALELEDYARAKMVLDQIEWPTEKPPALVTIDDRAITFDGTWPTIESLLNFKPWNKKVRAALKE